MPAPPQPATAAADQLSQGQLSMCKPAQPNMSSEDTNQYGLNISILHGFFFGSGAMTVLLILGLGLLWLKCKRKPQNSAIAIAINGFTMVFDVATITFNGFRWFWTIGQTMRWFRWIVVV